MIYFDDEVENESPPLIKKSCLRPSGAAIDCKVCAVIRPADKFDFRY
jgi:hypothetical protein